MDEAREERYKSEIQHLNRELLQANQDCALMESVKMERDELRKKWDEFVTCQNQPLVHELQTLRHIVNAQRQQMRLLANVFADQPNWINEWKKMCDENAEIRARLKAMQDGSELEALKRRQLELESQLDACRAAYHHRGKLLSEALMQMDFLKTEIATLRR